MNIQVVNIGVQEKNAYRGLHRYMKAFARHMKGCRSVNNPDELLWILGLDIARRGHDGPQLTDTAGKVPKALTKVLKAFVKGAKGLHERCRRFLWLVI
jgi:23S rRNA pseudoU1915 N3-methylase RlmH